MLSSTIKTQIEQDLLNYHLSPYGFAEAITVKPKYGAERTIYAYVEESVRLDMSEGGFGGDTLTEVEEITVLASRDENAVDSNGTTIGGISEPEIGDAVRRTSAYDPEQRDYYYAGQLELRSDVHIEIVYERRKRRAQAAGGGK